MRRFAWIALLVLLAAPAQAGTYYIDWTAGDNTNAGTSTATAWKCHPYHTGNGGACGAAPSYTHAAGDFASAVRRRRNAIVF